MAGNMHAVVRMMCTEGWLAVLCVFLLSRPASALKCYECKNAATNEDCSNVLDCDVISTPTTRYDRCQTKVTTSETSEYSITKRCAVGPCHLGGGQDTALGLQCDRSSVPYTCEYCCDSDLCNVSGAPARPPPVLLLLAAAALTLLNLLVTRTA